MFAAFPGCLCFPAGCAFRGERAVFDGGFTLALYESCRVLCRALRACPAC